MKYKLVSLSCTIRGRLFKKEQGIIFDTESNFKGYESELQASCNAGFLELVPEIVEEPEEVEDDSSKVLGEFEKGLVEYEKSLEYTEEVERPKKLKRSRKEKKGSKGLDSDK